MHAAIICGVVAAMKADTRRPCWGREEQSYNENAKSNEDVKGKLGCDEEWKIPRRLATITESIDNSFATSEIVQAQTGASGCKNSPTPE